MILGVIQRNGLRALADVRRAWATQKAMGAHRKAYPRCAVCGLRRIWGRQCEVHHEEPVHVRPDRAADPGNMITLCRAHHWEIGHFGDWRRAWNAKVRQTADTRARVMAEMKSYCLNMKRE